MPGVFTAGITLQITSVICVGHSYPYPELLEVLYAGAKKGPGYGYSMLLPARNFWKLCTPVPEYPELLEVLQDFHTRTRNFWKFCTTFIPVPRTSE